MGRVLFLALAAAAWAPNQVRGQDPWDVAAAGIERLVLADFPDVPAGVRARLTALQCRIPQSWGEGGPHNVVAGSFAISGQTDWAALCSVGGASSIVIVWGGDKQCPSPIRPPLPDRTHLQALEAQGILYSRRIAAVRVEAEQWSRPPDGTRDAGLEAVADTFLEKGATAYLCADGQWLTLTSD